MLSNFLYKRFAGFLFTYSVLNLFNIFGGIHQTLGRSMMRGKFRKNQRKCRERVAGRDVKKQIEGRSKIGKKDGKKMEKRRGNKVRRTGREDRF
jgi:hypothetical protein